MTALQIINKRVKALKKDHPNTSRQMLMKRAGREYRAGELPGSASKASTPKKKKAAAPKRKRSVASKPATNNSGSLSAAQLKSELRKRITEQLDRAVVQKFHATKKRDKTKIQKVIIAKKRELNKLY